MPAYVLSHTASQHLTSYKQHYDYCFYFIYPDPPLRAHRWLLAARCTWFQALFNSGAVTRVTASPS